jgi:hypothetical protein
VGRILASTNIKAALEASRNLPQKFDQVDVALRGGPYGEIYSLPLLPEPQVSADEGSFWTVTNPTPGTGIATIAAQASLADTAPFILFKNNSSPTDPLSKRIIAKWLRITCTAAGTAGAQLRFATKTDSAGARYTSGATVIAGNNTIGAATNQPVNSNSDIGTASGIQLYAGPIVATAAASPRLIDAVTARITIPIVGDSFLLVFGANEANSNGSLVATVTQLCIPMAPWVVGPQQWGAFHLWLPSQSAASSYEFTFAYTER